MKQIKYVRFEREGAVWHVLDSTYNTYKSPRRTQTRVVTDCGREYDATKAEVLATYPTEGKMCVHCPSQPIAAGASNG